MAGNSNKGSSKNKFHSGGLAPNRVKKIPSRLNVTKSRALTAKPKYNYGSGGKGIEKTKFSK